jgi:hypothetical protein
VLDVEGRNLLPVTGTLTAWQIMTVRTSDELGIGVVAIDDSVASSTTMTYSPALRLMP